MAQVSNEAQKHEVIHALFQADEGVEYIFLITYFLMYLCSNSQSFQFYFFSGQETRLESAGSSAS